MRRHHMLICSLGLFAMGILCQIYNVFYPNEPYMQQMSFMFVAMPSALAIINHYYHQLEQPLQQPLIDPLHIECEEKQRNSSNTGSYSTSSLNHVLNPKDTTSLNHVATTSPNQRPRGKTHDFSCNDGDDDDGTELHFGEFN